MKLFTWIRDRIERINDRIERLEDDQVLVGAFVVVVLALAGMAAGAML